jgi:serine-type D-Ala-D-Ala carboxypeptidase (penicillin-binding protein 5/6)
LIVVINGLKTASDRANEGKRLIEWGFKGFESRPLFADGQAIGDAKVFGGASRTVPLVADGMVGLLIPRGSGDRVLARISYTGPVRAPVAKGLRIGTLKVWRGDRVALEVPLMAGEDVPVGSLSRRAVDGATELMISLFRAGAKRI